MTQFSLHILAFFTVLLAILVITAQSPIVAVLYLISVFVLAALYLLMNNLAYVGLTYLVVYVGAVAVLFLFVVMMFNVELSEVVTTGYEYTAGVPLGALVAMVFLLEVFSVTPSIISVTVNYYMELIDSLNFMLLNVPNTTHLILDAPHFDAEFVYTSQVQALGLSLYTYGFLWLMLMSFVLLLAMLGPIALCHRSQKLDPY